jgi:uncharacterized FAD-dependent dehydrogenase
VPSLVDLAVHPDVMLDEDALRREVARAAGLGGRSLAHMVVRRRAVDARRGKVRVQLRVEVWHSGEPFARERILRPDLPPLRGEPQVVIVGAGPAGMFCAWALARRGILSIVLERGKPVRARRRDIATLVRTGAIDPDSNYCFGEGGAGTFSDGKLYTRADKRGDAAAVLRALVAYGAPEAILVDARPHIGTNKLPDVVGSMRAHLEAAGVRFAFERRAEELVVRGDRVVGVRTSGGDVVEARAVVVAPGHSARDLLLALRRAGAPMSFKPFAMGVRVEHPQAFVDRLQLGAFAGHPAIGAASYRVVEHAGDLGVFSFCMCPGGIVCPAATEDGALVVNGWSPSSRRGRFANSGFVVEIDAARVRAEGLDPGDSFAGIELQRRLEEASYAAGGGRFVAPAQRLDDLVAGRDSTELPDCSYPRGVVPARLDRLLGALAAPLVAALRRVEAKMPGFVGAHALAVAPESRTSCPVRVERGADGQSPARPGLFPCGEGAGFAGGIMSAALDGVRAAEAIARALG